MACCLRWIRSWFMKRHHGLTLVSQNKERPECHPRKFLPKQKRFTHTSISTRYKFGTFCSVTFHNKTYPWRGRFLLHPEGYRCFTEQYLQSVAIAVRVDASIALTDTIKTNFSIVMPMTFRKLFNKESRYPTASRTVRSFCEPCPKAKGYFNPQEQN